MSFSADGVERKVLAILKILSGYQEPVGSRIIARKLKEHGVFLNERTVRYHLKLADERGFTQLIGNIDGRVITEKGLTEIKRALVTDKVGFAISRIELLAFRTDFDYINRRGFIPVNITFFSRENFEKALPIMQPIFENGFGISQMVLVAYSGQKIGEVIVPEGKVGFVTVCSIVINGALLKAGIPMDSRFGGILQLNNYKPKRFTEIINYDGCSLDPSEIFIKARMTSVRDAVNSGSGEILANFREIPAICLSAAEQMLAGLKSAGIAGVIKKGNPGEPVCEIPVDPNKIGIVILGGLNPVAAVQEAGIVADNQSMATIMNYASLFRFEDLLKERSKWQLQPGVMA